MSNKYLKYKNIYLQLKKSQYNLVGGEIKYECPKDYPYLCPNTSNNFGLCIKDKSKIKQDILCNKLDDYNKDNYQIPIVNNDLLDEKEKEKEIIQQNTQRGNEKGYIETNLTNSCYIQSNSPIIYDYNLSSKHLCPSRLRDEKHLCPSRLRDEKHLCPNEFSIITLNIMGIYRNNESVYNLMKLRMNMLNKELLELKPDILCFQEMSNESFELLYNKELQKIYPFYCTNDIYDLHKRNKDIEVFIISKYPIKKAYIYPLEGNLGYTNSLGIYEFDNIIIFNVYMQAGSKKSPGQKYKYQHYSRCRSQQLLFIKSIIDSYKPKPCIVLGDFNFDLNGTIEDWPEKNIFDSIGLSDSWTKGLDESGLTENTDINHMRYNSKLEEKKLRYDAILYTKENIELLDKSSKVICKNGLYLEDELFKYNDDYIKAILPKTIPNGTNLKYKKNNSNSDASSSESFSRSNDSNSFNDSNSSNSSDGSNRSEGSSSSKIFELFISDHFGVYCKFKLK